MKIKSSFLLSPCSSDGEGTRDCVDLERGSFDARVRYSLCDNSAVTDSYEGGGIGSSSMFSRDTMLVLDICRGGSGGGPPAVRWLFCFDIAVTTDISRR